MNRQELTRLDGPTYEVPYGRSMVTFLTVPRYAESDTPYLLMWLRSKQSPHTRSAYVHDIERFYLFVSKSLKETTLTDIQNFADSLRGEALATQARILATVKSCFTFCYKLGYLPVNVSRAQSLPQPKEELASRILSEQEVSNMLFVVRGHPRNHVLLCLLYRAGLRAQEAADLTWRDCSPREGTGQITVYGKRNKTRQILLKSETWKELQSLRTSTASLDDYIFQSRKQVPSRKLTTAQIYRIVAAAARDAGIEANVSPHWLRHAHATHALEHHAPITLVKETLGHSSIAVTNRYAHARPDASSAQYLEI